MLAITSPCAPLFRAAIAIFPFVLATKLPTKTLEPPKLLAVYCAVPLGKFTGISLKPAQRLLPLPAGATVAVLVMSAAQAVPLQAFIV